MKNCKILSAAVGVVVMGGMTWLVWPDQAETPKTNEWVVAERLEAAKDTSGTAPISQRLVETPTAIEPIAVAPILAATPAATMHVALAGETVGSIAADLPGNQGHAYRVAIINANPSLKADPDRLLTGQSYVIPASPEVAAAPALAEPTIRPEPASQPKAEIKPVATKKPVTELRYTARAGDTVIAMAEAFLGSGSKANQDAIVAANTSLDADRNQVVAGQTYRIPAPDGLSASATSSSDRASVRPMLQPDADQLVAGGAPRSLRYTARPGDTVTTLAIALLGSDTVQARDAIINHNPEMKTDPDRVIAGQTYFIPAPAADVP